MNRAVHSILKSEGMLVYMLIIKMIVHISVILDRKYRSH
jgi:hypothetical protein